MTLWNELILEVDRVHLALVEELRAAEPRMWSRAEAWGNDVFPLSASLTLNLAGPHRDQDLVLAVRFALEGSVLDFDSDVSRDDGRIIADGPHARLALTSSEEPEIVWAASRISEYRAFLHHELSLIQTELSELSS